MEMLTGAAKETTPETPALMTNPHDGQVNPILSMHNVIYPQGIMSGLKKIKKINRGAGWDLGLPSLQYGLFKRL